MTSAGYRSTRVPDYVNPVRCPRPRHREDEGPPQGTRNRRRPTSTTTYYYRLILESPREDVSLGTPSTGTPVRPGTGTSGCVYQETTSRTGRPTDPGWKSLPRPPPTRTLPPSSGHLRALKGSGRDPSNPSGPDKGRTTVCPRCDSGRVGGRGRREESPKSNGAFS